MSRQFQALNAISRILGWDDDEQANKEFGWLRFMAKNKFDNYQDFLAGARFIESLVVWLQQFNSLEERLIAYDFLRKRLLFISASEMNHLVERFYARVVVPDLISRAATQHGIQTYQVLSHPDASNTIQKMRQRILFMGLSDGARIDVLRRANSTILHNDQIVMQPFLDDEKWRDLSKKLKDLSEDVVKKFDTVYIIDDFAGSGTTFIRKNSTGKWNGKLPKLWRSLSETRSRLKNYDEFPIVDDPSVHVHHYIVTEQAKLAMLEKEFEIRKDLKQEGWFPKPIPFTEGMVLPKNFSLTPPDDQQFFSLTDHYYDKDLETIHSKESGNPDMRRGYAQCALPLILEHNTPNNSVSLLWAETEGTQGHAMRPLFRRRQRHS
ncbi:MAG: hypothetical protein HQL75_07665 [Magnetococcales bacterium]|nr:hypothetical protein [Magnetococcales bacterium]